MRQRRPLLFSSVLIALIVRIDALAAQNTPSDQRASQAQSLSPSASIVGVVLAPDDARLPGATITITGLETGRSLVLATAPNGSYRGSGLQGGNYAVRAELFGFETQVTPVTLVPGTTATIDFKLPLATLSESVTVTGTAPREGAKASLEVSEIRESTARDIGEALGQLPGVAKVRKGAIGNDVVLQGFQSRNLTVLINGDRIYGACPNGMDPSVFHADFAEVDHLEVSKGPFDVRHQGSLGGVVNVVTRAPAKGFHVNPNLSVGSFGFVNPSAIVSYGGDRLSLLGGYSFRQADPYRDGSGTLYTQYANYRPETVASTAFRAHTGWARVFFSPRPNHSLQVAYTRQQATHLAYAYLLMDGVSDDADRLNATYTVVRDEKLAKTLTARAYYTKVAHWMTDELRKSSIGFARPYSMGTQADTSTAGGSVEFSVGQLTTGLEAYRRKWDATTMMAGSGFVPQYAIPFVAVDNVGGFVEYQRDLWSGTRLEAGARYDWSHSAADATRANTNLYFAYKGTTATSATDTGTSGKVRVIHRFGTNLDVDLGVGRTNHVPDPEERYYGLKRSGSDWVGNPGLVPTVNTGVYVGANYHHPRLTASLAVFHDWLTNFIALHGQQKVNTVAGVMNSAARSYANVDGRMTGAEVQVTCPFSARLSATLNATYTRGTKDINPSLGITSRNMEEIHPPSGTATLRYDRAVFFAEVQEVVSTQHVYVDTDLQEDPMPGYGLMNVRVGSERNGVRLTFAVDNVFNNLYVDHMSYQRDPFRIGVRVREPGRNYYVNVAYRF
jgi:iron complex outermembrane recepter protein